MSRHLSAANTVESKPWAGAGRAGSRSSVTATRVNERTDTGFRPPQGVWNGVTHISTERPNPARASRRRPGCVSEPQCLGIGITGISIGFSVMDDLASAPRPVSARSPCLPCVFTSPKGTSRDAHTSPPSSVVTWSARNVPAGTLTDSQPTTCAPLHRPAQSKAEVFCLPCLPIIPAISPDIFMAGCGPTLKTSARGASSPDARLAVRICTTPLLPGSFPAKLTSNQYRVESPDRSEPTTARRSFPPPEPPLVPSKDAHWPSLASPRPLQTAARPLGL